MKPVYVNISNVATWMNEENPQEEWGFEDFPCLAMPWPNALFKYHMPRFFNDSGVKKYLPKGVAGTPLEIASIQVEIPEEHRTPAVIRETWGGRILTHYFPNIRLRPMNLDSPIMQKALITVEERPCRFITLHGVKFAGQMLEFCACYIDEDGAGIVVNTMPVNTAVLSTPEMQTDLSLFYPVFMAISLLHCKNVELIDEPITRQMKRQKERKGGEFYKVLVIEPFKKQTRREAAEHGETEMKRALHICRGHFATYTDAAPLFGKYVGTFWKPMHVKGNKQYGEVKKDYKVKR